jgi:hypothetical protein
VRNLYYNFDELEQISHRLSGEGVRVNKSRQGNDIPNKRDILRARLGKRRRTHTRDPRRYMFSNCYAAFKTT